MSIWKRQLLGFVCSLIVATTASLTLGTGLAWGAPHQVTVAIDDSFAPLAFRDDAGHLQGLTQELWRLWSSKTGIPVVFMTVPFAEGKRAVLEGRADVIDLITITQERQKELDFSEPYLSLDVAIYYHESISGITDAKSSRGFLVGAIKGHANTKRLMDAGSVNIAYYKNYEDLYRGVANGEVRVFISHTQQAGYFLNQYGLAKEFRASPPIFSLSGHWAVKKGNTALQNDIADGFRQISPAERQAVFDKWLGTPVSGRIPLYLEYAGWLLLTLACLAVLLFVWNRALSLRVAKRTRTLALALEDLKQAQASTVVAQEHLLSVLNAVPDLLIEIDAEGIVIHAHSARETKVGLAPRQLIGKRF